MPARTIYKVLIANRGEIACRINRTCQAMGIATVGVYSEADTDALHVSAVDEAVYIGPAAAAESYLNGERIISVALQAEADAIHPGFGFLAENATFAQAVLDAGLIWIGPTPDAIRAMGLKREAKRMLQGVPLVPGYDDEDQSDLVLSEAAERIGFPVMIKASAGGGGKGMRRVDAPGDFRDALAAARREASAAFGDSTLILEKYIERPRHIEIQIFGDQHGNVRALGERECSIQRRHQKIVEETPSTAVDDVLRRRMFDAAEAVGHQLGYVGAGTVEFLVDQSGAFYFMEMNTRLQVEHPVTEMVGGIDLVQWQIRVAQGEPLPDVPEPLGHAIEVRIYAEDPARGFLPAAGPVLTWQPPSGEGIRVDDGIRSGGRVTPDYDPMIAKVIAHDSTREGAIRRLNHALRNTVLFGLAHNIAFLRRVLLHPQHLSGDISTQFLDQHPELASDEAPADIVQAGVIAAALSRRTPGTWRNNPYRPVQHRFNVNGVNGETLTVALTPLRSGMFAADIADAHYAHVTLQEDAHSQALDLDGHRRHITLLWHEDICWLNIEGYTLALQWQSPLPVPGRLQGAEGSLRAPMPGQVIAVNATVDAVVAEGDVLLTMEAMKMEHQIRAPYHGRVTQVYFKAGDAVPGDAILLEVTPIESDNGAD